MSSSAPTAWCQLVPLKATSARWFLQGIRHLGSGRTLCYLFELEQAWLPNSKLSDTLENTIRAIPFDDSEQTSTWFEKVLLQINQALVSVASAGETDWIGSLNAVILIEDGDTVHFSQTGRLPTYLLQRNRIRQITDNVPGDEAFSTTPFVAISSGTLQTDDIVVCGNLELYRTVSLDALRRIMVGRTPYEVCTLLAQEIRSKQVKGVSAICFSAGSTSEQPEQIFLEHIFESLAQRTYRTMKPVVKKASGHTLTYTKSRLQAGKQQARSIKAVALPLAKQGAKRIQSTIESLKGPAAEPPVVEIIVPSLLVQRKPFTNPLTRIGRKPALLGAALLIGVIAVGAISRRTHSAVSSETTTKLSGQRQEAEQDLKAATAAQQLNQSVEASRILSQAAALISSLPSDSGLSEKYTSTLASISGAKSPTVSQPVQVGAIRLAEAGGWLYGISKGSVQAARIDGPERIHLASSAKAQYSDVVRGAGNTVFALGSSGGIDRLTPSPTLLLTQPLSPASGTFTSGSALTSYQNNLYILDPTRQTLWKYIGDDTSYRSGTTSFTSPLIADGATISTNGSFYLLSATGTVSKFVAGKQVSGFSLTGIPVSLPNQKYRSLFASVTPLHLYMLSPPTKPHGIERSQLTQFNDQGTYEQAYILPPELDDATSLTLSEDGTAAWVGTGINAYKISL